MMPTTRWCPLPDLHLPGRTFIARHGETVFNAAARIQGDLLHTPLTRGGFAQADAMGERLEKVLSEGDPLALWASPTGRALQTIAVIAEHLGEDWHAARTDARLAEIGMGGWDGRPYAEVEAEVGPIYDRRTHMFVQRPSGGETHADVAARLRGWVADVAAAPDAGGDRLVVMHGVSSRVLRGLLVGGIPHPDCTTPLAPMLPQGSVVLIEGGRERVVVRGTGH